MSTSNKILIPDPENLEMSYLLRLIRETDRSIFLTGKAGTGKSTLLKHISRSTKKKHVVLAPTGISALNAEGQTIHSFFKLPFSPIPPGDQSLKTTLKRIRSEQRKLIRNLELIIIDEVSMVRSDIIDAIDVLLRMVRGKMYKPFGGIQMLFVGDLFQLEPVVTQQDAEILSRFYNTYFYYGALAFHANKPIIVELTKVYRQKDRQFVELLDRIRTGEATQHDVELLNAHTGRDNKRTENKEIQKDDFNVTLTTRRDRASNINEEHLNQLKGKPISFKGSIKDDFPEGSLPTELNLTFKEGAQVMFVANDPEHQWVNGSLGYFTDYNPELGIAEVQLENGEICTVEPFTWENKRYKLNEETNSIEEEIIGKFTQIPLKLAWAITIHKSQGLTFEHVTIDFCNGTFAAGQAYVALSRCRSLEGMILERPFRKYDIITRPEVVSYYQQAGNEEVFQQALEESLAIDLYTSSCEALNKGDLELSIKLLSQALETRDLLGQPRMRKLFIQKLYHVAGAIDKHKKIRQEEAEQQKKLAEMAMEYIQMGDQCKEEIMVSEEVALTAYEKALVLVPNHPLALARKAQILRSSVGAIEAVELLQKPYDDLPLHRELTLQLALAYADLGNQQRAFDLLCRLQTEYSTDLELLTHLVKMADSLGYKEHKKRFQGIITRIKRSDKKGL